MISIGNNFPKDEKLRVYYSLAIACLLFTKYKTPTNNESFNIGGQDDEIARYLWTALMIIGPTVDPKFNPKCIKISTLLKFKPEQEAGWVGTFGSNSLHDRVFLKVLEGTNVSFDKDEVNKEFGHQVPEKHISIKKELQKLLCENFLAHYFIIKDHTLSFQFMKDKTALSQIGIVKLVQALAYVPDNVETIKTNEMYYDDVPFLTKFLRALPKNSRTLDFSFSYPTSVAKWPQIFESVSPNIKTIKVAYCYLNKLLPDNFAKMISATPLNVNYIVFDMNELDILGEEGLIKGLRVIPPHVRSVSLRDNRLNRFTGAQLANIFRVIPPTVTFLDLSDNVLQGMKQEKPLANRHSAIAEALAGLHDKLSTLVLQDNLFDPGTGKDLEEFAKIFQKMPRSVTKLYVSEERYKSTRDWTKLDNITLAEAFKYLPEHTTVPNSDILMRAKQGIKDKEEKLKRDKEARSKNLLVICKKFDATVQEIRQLIDEGIDINYQAADTGYTALMLTLDAQNERIAEYLLSKGADPLIKNKGGETARSLVSRNSLITPILKGYELLFATMASDIIMVKSLVNSDNSLIDFRGVSGYTALLIAVEQSLPDIVSFLLAKNADLSLTRDDGKGSMDLANDETIKEMLNAANSVDNLPTEDDTGLIEPDDNSVPFTLDQPGTFLEKDDFVPAAAKPESVPSTSDFFRKNKSSKKPTTLPKLPDVAPPAPKQPAVAKR